MKDQIIELIISVNDTQAGFPLVWEMFLIPIHQFIEKRYSSYWFSGIDIDCLGLHLGNTGQGFDLARKVVRGWSEISESYVNWVKGRQRSKDLHSGDPTEGHLFSTMYIANHEDSLTIHVGRLGILQTSSRQ